MEDKQLTAFGLRLRELRIEHGFSQEELGLLAELDRTYISGIERGTRNVGLINVFRIAKALDVPVAALFTEKKAR